MSNTSLQKATGMSYHMLQEHLKELEDNKFIKIVYSSKDGKKYNIRTIVPLENPQNLVGQYTYTVRYRGSQYAFEMSFTKTFRVPKGILFDSKLEVAERAIYIASCAFCERDEAYFEGGNYMFKAVYPKMGEKKIAKSVTALEELGMLERTTNPPHKTLFVIRYDYEVQLFPMYWDLKRAVDMSGASTIKSKNALMSIVRDAAGKPIPLDTALKEILASQRRISKWICCSEDDEIDDEDFEDKPAYVMPKVKKSTQDFIEACKEADENHPTSIYCNSDRGYNLLTEKSDFQAALIKYQKRFLDGTLSLREKVICQITAMGGIPADYAFPDKAKELEMAIDLLMDSVPGIENSCEDGCIQVLLSFLKNITTSEHQYYIKGEPIEGARVLHTINRLLTADHSGYTLAGLLQHIGKAVGKEVYGSRVSSYKSTIPQATEELCRKGERIPVLDPKSTEFNEKFGCTQYLYGDKKVPSVWAPSLPKKSRFKK